MATLKPVSSTTARAKPARAVYGTATSRAVAASATTTTSAVVLATESLIPRARTEPARTRVAAANSRNAARPRTLLHADSAKTRATRQAQPIAG